MVSDAEFFVDYKNYTPTRIVPSVSISSKKPRLSTILKGERFEVRPGKRNKFSQKEIRLMTYYNDALKYLSFLNLDENTATRVKSNLNTTLKQVSTLTRGEAIPATALYLALRLSKVSISFAEFRDALDGIVDTPILNRVWSVAQKYSTEFNVSIVAPPTVSIRPAINELEETECSDDCKNNIRMLLNSIHDIQGGKKTSYNYLLSHIVIANHGKAVPSKRGNKYADSLIKNAVFIVERDNNKVEIPRKLSLQKNSVLHLKCKHCGTEWTINPYAPTKFPKSVCIGLSIRATKCPKCGASNLRISGIELKEKL